MIKLLLTVSLLELFIGGSGRLLEVGPGTVRMILFAACVCASVFVAIFKPRKGDGVALAFGLVLAYLLVHVAGLLTGAIKGLSFESGSLEMRQSLYWLTAPFYAVALRSRDMVLHVARLVRIAGAVLAVAYIGVIVALALGSINFLDLYATLAKTDDFMFRGDTFFFFYKGFLYLCISTLFFLAIRTRFSAIWATVVAIAVVMTLSRGLVLATAMAALLMLVAQRRWRTYGLVLAVVGCIAFSLWSYLGTEGNALSEKFDLSIEVRIEDFDYIVDNFKVGSLLLGKGLGALINGRLNIENTFLWACWRLGVIGVAFWITPLVLCMNYFFHIRRRDPCFSLACAYLFSTILVYIQTIANPYLNNPIGLSFVLAALFSLRTIARTEALSGSISKNIRNYSGIPVVSKLIKADTSCHA